MNERPIIGVTMGDPASIGPEITVKAFGREEIYKKCRPIVIGDAVMLEQAKQIVGMSSMKINPVCLVEDAKFEFGTIDVLDLKLVDIKQIDIGKVSPSSGEAAFQYIKKLSIRQDIITRVIQKSMQK